MSKAEVYFDMGAVCFVAIFKMAAVISHVGLVLCHSSWTSRKKWECDRVRADRRTYACQNDSLCLLLYYKGLTLNRQQFLLSRKVEKDEKENNESQARDGTRNCFVMRFCDDHLYDDSTESSVFFREAGYSSIHGTNKTVSDLFW